VNLIGGTLTVLSSSDPSKVGRSGKVLLETANTLVIQSGLRSIAVEKKGASFLLGTGATVSGADIAGRLQDRLGRALR
jgi:RNase P/RNase MRP subunit p29